MLACLSAQDLHDYAPEEMGDGYSKWKERWRGRLKGHRYWIGLVPHLCFPWSETDRLLWNPVKERAETAWHVVPPELCLENRVPSAVRIRVQVPVPAVGPLKPPDHVFYCDQEGQIVVGEVRTGKAIGLTGAGSQMWRSLVEQGTCEAASEVLLRHFEVEADKLKDDLSAFVRDLLERGLLEDARVDRKRQEAPTPRHQ